MKQESFTGFMHEVMDGLRQEERFDTRGYSQRQ